MSLSIYNLGEDILTSQISNYLSPEDIFKFFSLSKTLYSIYQNSSIIYQYLYNKSSLIMKTIILYPFKKILIGNNYFIYVVIAIKSLYMGTISDGEIRI